MSWYSYTFAFSAPCELALQQEPNEALRHPHEALRDRANDDFVYSHSRNGALLATVRRICALVPKMDRLYLLDDARTLHGSSLREAAAQLDALLAYVAQVPGVVVEATKAPYVRFTEIFGVGIPPMSAEIIYSKTATVRDGWVYEHTEAEVLSLLNAAADSHDPCLPNDEEGESLAYVFAYLKSHRALLERAVRAGLAVVFGELNSH
ncbi:MAG: hypothetical protein EPO06_07295 [Burkholderiaceae bacterium]|nr:MAG: hypothetical protein EPO06_07295 [Burkholderiaceae bacterium]